MRLTMTLGEEIIDSVEVEPHRCKQEGYLEAMMRCLQVKHAKTWKGITVEPCFYLEVSSRMNEDNAKYK